MVVVDVVVPVVVALAVADEDHSGHGHGHVYDHDLLRLSRDYGGRRQLVFFCASCRRRLWNQNGREAS